MILLAITLLFPDINYYMTVFQTKGQASEAGRCRRNQREEPRGGRTADSVDDEVGAHV